MKKLNLLWLLLIPVLVIAADKTLYTFLTQTGASFDLANDYFYVWDKSDTSADPNGRAKKMTGSETKVALGIDSGATPTFNGVSLGTGTLSHSGQRVMGATTVTSHAIDETKQLNVDTLTSTTATLTFLNNGTHVSGRMFGIFLIGHTSDCLVTLDTTPDLISVDRQSTAITQFLVPANAKLLLTVLDYGGNYYLFNDPGNSTGLTSIASGKTFTASNSLTIAGTDGTTMTFPSTSASIGRIDAAQTLAGTQTLAENVTIALDPAGSADGKFTGISIAGTGGATIAVGDLVTLDKDDSRWELVDVSVAAAATGDARGILGIAMTTSTDGGAITVLLQGTMRADANFPTLTIGAPVYASTTGDITSTQPTTTDHVIRIIGYALTADEIYFFPAGTWTTHT